MNTVVISGLLLYGDKRILEERWRRQREEEEQKKEEQERVGEKGETQIHFQKTHTNKRHNSLWLIDFSPFFLTHAKRHKSIHNASSKENKDGGYSEVGRTNTTNRH